MSEIYSGTTKEETTGGGRSETLASKVQPGDYVTYTPDPVTTTDTAYTDLNTDLTTYSGTIVNTSSTLTQEEGLKWRVLDVVDGKVRLISATPTTSKLTLSGANGYNNAVYLLDKTCETLYSKSGYSENVQSLKIEDIQNKMSTDYTTIDSNYGKTFSPSAYKYPFIFSQEEGQTVSVITQPETRLKLSEQTTPIDKPTPYIAYSWTVKYTYWNKSMAESDFTNPIYYNLYIAKKNEDDTYSNYSEYWMSSRCVRAYSTIAHFSVRDVVSGVVGADYLCDSNGSPYSCEFALRPVVTLNSNVLVKSGEGTLESAYEI